MAISKAKRVDFSCLSSWILDLSEICFALEIDKKKKTLQEVNSLLIINVTEMRQFIYTIFLPKQLIRNL